MDMDIGSLSGGDPLQKFPKFEGIVPSWKKSEWAQHWCRNVPAGRICAKSLTPVLLLPPEWPFLMTLTAVGLHSRQHPFYLFLSTCISLYILETAVTGWMHPGGRKHFPILPEQLKSDHRLHDKLGRRDLSLSICRTRNTAQKWGQVGIDTQTKGEMSQETGRTSMNLLCPRGPLSWQQPSWQ